MGFWHSLSQKTQFWKLAPCFTSRTSSPVLSPTSQLGAIASAALGISPMTAGLAVLCTGLALYEPICAIVGGQGASFNPSQNFAFAAAGQGSLSFHAFRSVSTKNWSVIELQKNP